MDILNNVVLVLPDADFDKIGSMELSDIFTPARHYSVFGRVLQLPRKLICERELVQGVVKRKGYTDAVRFVQQCASHSLEYDAQMELMVGDRVCFRYNIHFDGKEEGNWIEVEGGMALLVPYDAIYFAVRGGQTVMVNGFLLVEPVQYDRAEFVKECFGLEVDKEDMDKKGFGIVRHIGKPIDGYLIDLYKDVDEIKGGDLVMFNKGFDTPVEWGAHKTMADRYFKMQRKDILAIING